jgi:serine/threonine-protein kinase
MPLADGATSAGYTIVRLLGSGGMGEVYLAQHPRLPRRDALEVLPAAVSAETGYRQRFNREADIAAAATPPPEPVQPPPTSLSQTSPAASAPPPEVVIGASCSPEGSTATTAQGTTAYCSTLQPSGTTVWSPQRGDIPSPTETTEPTDTPLPTEDDPPTRMCMQQTGMTRLQCWDAIRRSNRRLP